MGKSEDQIKKRAKDTPKSPISPVWLGTYTIETFIVLFSLAETISTDSTNSSSPRLCCLRRSHLRGPLAHFRMITEYLHWDTNRRIYKTKQKTVMSTAWRRDRAWDQSTGRGKSAFQPWVRSRGRGNRRVCTCTLFGLSRREQGLILLAYYILPKDCRRQLSVVCRFLPCTSCMVLVGGAAAKQ